MATDRTNETARTHQAARSRPPRVPTPAEVGILPPRCLLNFCRTARRFLANLALRGLRCRCGVGTLLPCGAQGAYLRCEEGCRGRQHDQGSASGQGLADAHSRGGRARRRAARVGQRPISRTSRRSCRGTGSAPGSHVDSWWPTALIVAGLDRRPEFHSDRRPTWSRRRAWRSTCTCGRTPPTAGRATPAATRTDAGGRARGGGPALGHPPRGGVDFAGIRPARGAGRARMR